MARNDQNTPPPDWMVLISDFQQVQNLMNNDTCRIGADTPVAERLLTFLMDSRVSALWESFSRGKPRV